MQADASFGELGCATTRDDKTPLGLRSDTGRQPLKACMQATNCPTRLGRLSPAVPHHKALRAPVFLPDFVHARRAPAREPRPPREPPPLARFCAAVRARARRQSSSRRVSPTRRRLMVPVHLRSRPPTVHPPPRSPGQAGRPSPDVPAQESRKIAVAAPRATPEAVGTIRRDSPH